MPAVAHLLSLSEDVLAHSSGFLSINDLLLCSALCRSLHALFDSDRVWRPRLLHAEAVQSAVRRDRFLFDDDDSAKASRDTAQGEEGDGDRHMDVDDDQKEEEAKIAHVTAPSPSPHPSSSPSTSPLSPAHPSAVAPASSQSSTSPPALPSMLTVHALCLAWLSEPATMRRHLELPPHMPSPPFAPAVVAIVHVPSSPQSSPVYHVKSITRYLEFRGVCACFELELEWASAAQQWAVRRCGPRNSGTLALLADENVHTFTAPAPMPPSSTARSCKQRYVARLTCSCHARHRCFSLLPPYPMEPAPAPPPHWFSQHLRDAVVNGGTPPPMPVSPFPPHLALPLCRRCVVLLAHVFQQHADGFHLARDRRLHVVAVVRVNHSEFDVCLRHYEDEQQFHRFVLRWDGARSHVACMFELDSGAYAIDPDTHTVPGWENPAPPRPGPRLRTDRHAQHPLAWFPVSPYRHALYTCNECAASESGSGWHCERCQYDACPRCIPAPADAAEDAPQPRLARPQLTAPPRWPRTHRALSVPGVARSHNGWP